jgi:outer membrane lipoprotein-sorting protein
MRRRTLALIAAGAVIAVVLVVGVVTAGAQSPSSLPSITVSQLLQNVATKAQNTTAVSGDVAWSNDLLGSSSLLSLGGNQTPAGLSSLLTGGSGRVWAQNGKARLESQGQNGDFVAVANGVTIWTWDSMTNTATRYSSSRSTPSSGSGAAMSPSAASRASLDPATAIAALIQKLAPNAALSVSGQAVVAGRQTYTLTLTPTSPVTTFGSVRVAIDGQRWVPLRVQVFARGDGSAVMSAGFKTVSFSSISDSLFSFSPPSGATVIHKQLGAEQLGTAQGAPVKGQTAKVGAAEGGAAHHAPLTLTQAKARAPFLLTPSSTPAGIAFRGAFVTPTTAKAQAAIGSPTAQQARMIAVLGKHPTAALDYGTGFGTVLVVESKTTAAQDAQVQQQLGQLSTIGKTTVNGVPATKLQTSLGSAVTFRQGDVRVIVAGFVPWSDLTQIAGSLQ